MLLPLAGAAYSLRTGTYPSRPKAKRIKWDPNAFGAAMPNLRARREVKSEARPGGMRALEQESSSGWDLRILTARKTQHQASHHPISLCITPLTPPSSKAVHLQVKAGKDESGPAICQRLLSAACSEEQALNSISKP